MRPTSTAVSTGCGPQNAGQILNARKSKDPSSNCLHSKNGSLSKPDIYGQEPHISFRQVIYYVDR